DSRRLRRSRLDEVATDGPARRGSPFEGAAVRLVIERILLGQEVTEARPPVQLDGARGAIDDCDAGRSPSALRVERAGLSGTRKRQERPRERGARWIDEHVSPVSRPN